MILNQYNYNQLRILNLLRLQPGISRIEIANRTGLGKATVSTIISAFMDEGIVFEEGTGEQLGPAVDKFTRFTGMMRRFETFAESIFSLKEALDSDELPDSLNDLFKSAMPISLCTVYTYPSE